MAKKGVVTDLFDDSDESEEVWNHIMKQHGLDVDTIGKPDAPLHDFSVIDPAEAEIHLLQNAYNRHLTVKQTLRLILEGRILIENQRSKGKEQ